MVLYVKEWIYRDWSCISVHTFGSLVCNLVGLLALPEGLIESLAESKVCLALGTLNEVLDLPGAGAGGFLGLWGRLSVGRRWGRLSVVLLGSRSGH